MHFDHCLLARQHDQCVHLLLSKETRTRTQEAKEREAAERRAAQAPTPAERMSLASLSPQQVFHACCAATCDRQGSCVLGAFASAP